MIDQKTSAAEVAAETYQRQGFGRSSGVGQFPGLIVVDFVNGFADPEVLGGGNINGAISATRTLLEFARSAGWPIAFTRVVFADDASDANVFARKVPSLLRLTESSAASAIVPELAPRHGELIVRKRLPSAFAGTELAAWMTQRKVDTAIVAGCTTSGCIRATVVDAMGHGFVTVVAVDCVGDRAAGPHEANLFDMQQKYADLMSVSDIKDAFAAPAVQKLGGAV